MRIYGWKPLIVSYHLGMFVGHYSSASADITYLICPVTSQEDVIEGLNDQVKLWLGASCQFW